MNKTAFLSVAIFLISCAEPVGSSNHLHTRSLSTIQNDELVLKILSVQHYVGPDSMSSNSVALTDVKPSYVSDCEGSSCLGDEITLLPHQLDMRVLMDCSDSKKLQQQLMLKSLRQACFAATGENLILKSTEQSLNSKCQVEKGCLTEIVVTRRGAGFKVAPNIGIGMPDSQSENSEELSGNGLMEASLSFKFSTVREKTSTRETCTTFDEMLKRPEFEVYRKNAAELVSSVCKSRPSR